MSIRVSRRNVFGKLVAAVFAALAAVFAPLVARFRSAGAGRQDAPARAPSDHRIDRAPNVTTCGYDTQGNLISVIEPVEGEVTSFTYDDFALIGDC